jgi:hypothetical protein
VVLPLLYILVGESCLLISWCAGDRCDMVGSDEDHDRGRRPSAEDLGWSSTGRLLGGRMIKRSGDAVSDLYHAYGDEECGFLGLASKPRSTVYQWFGLKITGSSFSVWATKPAATV